MDTIQRHSATGRTIGALLSLIMPGLGQLWRRRTMRAGFFMGLALAGWLGLFSIAYVFRSLPWIVTLGAALHVAAAMDAATFNETMVRRRRGKQQRKRHQLHRPRLP